MKANTWEAGADGKWFIFRCWPPGRWGTHISKPIFWEGGGLTSQNPSLPLSTGRGFYKEGGGWKVLYVQTSPVLSSKASGGLVCITPASAHCGFTSLWLHVILTPRVKVSKAPRAGIPEGWNLYLLKLVPRIPIQTCWLSTRYILVRVCTYRINCQKKGGWVTIPCYNFPLLQFHLFLSKLGCLSYSFLA